MGLEPGMDAFPGRPVGDEDGVRSAKCCGRLAQPARWQNAIVADRGSAHADEIEIAPQGQVLEPIVEHQYVGAKRAGGPRAGLEAVFVNDDGHVGQPSRQHQRLIANFAV